MEEIKSRFEFGLEMIEISLRRLKFLANVFVNALEEEEGETLGEMTEDFMPRIIRDLEGGFTMLKEKKQDVESTQ